MGSFLMSARGRISPKVIWRTLLAVVLLLFLSRWRSSELPPLDVIDPESFQQTGQPVDWSQYAYLQYATAESYVCNSVMIFESLVRLGTKAERLLVYPSHWPIGGPSYKGGLLAKARDEFGVHLLPIEIQHFEGEKTWADSFTKLLAFNQTQYKRVLSLDSDATVLQPMDELFLIPSTPVAAPSAYWLDKFSLSSQIVLIEPSETQFDRVQHALKHRKNSEYDMEIVNEL